MKASAEPKILFVDDESNILDALKRQLRNRFTIETAVGADAALALLRHSGPFAVVVSDMRMPGMNGIELLQEVQKFSADSVRLMLTGNADQETAIRAVNEGNIFRFLTKPCETDALSKALDDSLQQYRLIRAEKDLLEKTLRGSMKLLTDILSFVDPVGFGQSLKLRQLMQKALSVLHVENAWEIEIAAMLANLGAVTVPAPVLGKQRRHEALSLTEEELLDKVPIVGQTLVANIPRLGGVAQIILYQDKAYDGTGTPLDPMRGEQIPLGARVLKIVRDYSELIGAGSDPEGAFEALRQRIGKYDTGLLKQIRVAFVQQTTTTPPETRIYEVKAPQLIFGQTVLSNVETKDGALLLTAGTVLTEALLERLQNYSKFVGLKEPIRVDCLLPSEKH